MKYIEMSLDDKVKIKLTEEGKKKLIEYNTAYGIISWEESKEFVESKIKDGYYELMLWEIYEMFGDSIHNGTTKQYIKDNKIIIE